MNQCTNRQIDSGRFYLFTFTRVWITGVMQHERPQTNVDSKVILL